MRNKAKWAEVLVFLAFIALFFVLGMVLPEREFSEQENKSLQTRPEFSFSELFSGKFTEKYEKYTTDQFPFRDSWTTLKAASELALGKSENEGVALCGDDTLIIPFSAPENSVLDGSVDALNSLVENAACDVYFALIPGKSELLSPLLPKNIPNDSEAEVIDYCYSRSNANNVDILSALSEHSDEYIFYRTDHHWTSLGAYYGYAAIADAMGLTARSLDSYTERRTVSEEFYGTTWSKSGFSWIEPDSIEIFRDAPEGLKISTYESTEPKDGTLYDFSYLEKKDKYSMFMGGNVPLHEIETGSDGGRLLIVRDSYTDSLIPFLLDDFSSISVIDLRYYRVPLSSYIEEHDIDTVLVCYSVDNFCTDMNLFMLGR